MKTKHLPIIAALSLLVAMVLTFPAVSGAAGPSFVDNFSRPSDSWRFGNAVLSNGRNGLMLNTKQPEVTLVGTTLHPENLRTFTATIQWSFGRTGQPVLLVGWGKPREWSGFDECRLHLAVGREGRVTVMAGKQALGEAQLPTPVGNVYELTFTQQSQRVVLRSDRGEVEFPLPAGLETRPGYLMLRVQGLNPQQDEDSLQVQRVEIEHSGQHAPLTVQERHREIQAWAKEHLDGNWAVLEQFKTYLAAETSAARWGHKTDLAMRPGLVKPGEQVAVEFRVAGPIPSPCTARIEPDFLSANPGAAEPLSLDWQPDDHGGQVARVELTPRRPGNWRIVWQVGTEQLSRVLAVAEPGYTVCRILITTHPGMWIPGHAPEAYDVIHEYGMAADFWSGDEWPSPFSLTPKDLLAHFGFFSRMCHRWGDRVLPLANANWFIPGVPDANLWRFDDEAQREGIQQAARLWDALGLGPMEILGSYTFGHSTPRIARALGVKILDSLVQWQNWRDGGDDNQWLINHWGAPTVPYYVADDDFRKVAPGRSIVAFAQATTSNVRTYDIMTTEGQPQLNFRRSHGEAMGESSNIDRFQTTVDLWLAEAPHQAEPLFVSVGLENFLDSPDWNEANKRGVQYLREQARHQKLVFASAADIAGYFERHYAAQPENWLVWPDVYAGQAGGYKPRQLPDRIEVSNARFHTVHEDGVALPRFFWDFTRPWSEPAWDDQAAIRQKFGLVNPDLLTADNTVPRMVNLDGVRAEVQLRPQSSGVEIAVTVDASRPLATLPVAVWRVPLAAAGLTATGASRNARYITVVDGSTGNTHGLVVCNTVPRGRSTWTVRLQGQAREPASPGVQIGPHVRGRMFLRNTIPCVYLWLAEAGTPNGVLKIRVPAGRRVRVHDNDGRTEESSGGELTVILDRAWQHESPLVIGLTAAELQTLATFEPTK